ncbi:hypothetical protein ACFX1T_009843 [Malus domestica]
MASIFVKNQTQASSSQNLENFLSHFALYVSPREIPCKHHACKRSCRPTHKQTPSESRRIQSRDTSGGAAAASGETSPQNHHHSLLSTQDTQAKAFHCAVSSKMSGLAVMGYRVLASGRSNGAFRKHWSSNFGAVVCSIGSPFVLRETVLFVFWNRLQSARLEDLRPKIVFVLGSIKGYYKEHILAVDTMLGF